MKFTDEECYLLFIAMDNHARAFPDRADAVALRDKLLPAYRDWHAANPNRAHPSVLPVMTEQPS